jgi:hypothetical protein
VGTEIGAAMGSKQTGTGCAISCHNLLQDSSISNRDRASEALASIALETVCGPNDIPDTSQRCMSAHDIGEYFLGAQAVLQLVLMRRVSWIAAFFVFADGSAFAIPTFFLAM